MMVVVIVAAIVNAIVFGIILIRMIRPGLGGSILELVGEAKASPDNKQACCSKLRCAKLEAPLRGASRWSHNGEANRCLRKKRPLRKIDAKASFEAWSTPSDAIFREESEFEVKNGPKL